MTVIDILRQDVAMGDISFEKAVSRLMEMSEMPSMTAYNLLRGKEADPHKDRWDIVEKVWEYGVQCETCAYRCSSYSFDFGPESWCALGEQRTDHPGYCPGFDDEIEGEDND